jgi:two-component system response regulator VicR
MEKKRILVIEDDHDISDIITLVLQTEKFIVKAILNPLEAFAAAEEFKPDAILLDLTMPQMSGWEVYKKFRGDKNLSHIPIGIVTAKAEEFDAVVGLHVMHADAYITKPFGKQELIDKVTQLVNRDQ